MTFIVFTFLSIYTLDANPFAGETVAPFDRLLEMSGWSSVQSGVKAVHAERSDILDSQLPTWITLKDQIRRGESPLWYPMGAGGQPISLEIWNPTFLLFVAIKDNALAYYLVNVVKLVISGFGCYLLLNIFLRWLPSVWGGIVFMLCGFNSAWFFWEQVTTAMWIPWLLWTTVMFLKSDELKWLPAITIISLLLVFGGFFAVAGFGFYSFALLILVWNACHFFSDNWQETYRNTDVLKRLLRKTALPLLAVGIAFLMSAVSIIPFIDTMSRINLGYRTSGGIPLSLHDLELLFTYEDPPPVERTAYVGALVCILALVGIFRMFSKDDTKLRLFVFFNALLAAITLSIAFGLLPHQFIEILPIFKNNPKWGRLIVITLLALATLSAFGLDLGAAKLQIFSGRHLKLTPMNAQRTIAVLLIGIIAVQFHAQKTLFNRFNAVVPSAWFYPSTPSIAYVKEHLQPLQSVIADTSYFFAGTLGAYGISEWYAHSFRTDGEKEVLGQLVLDPFSSPTSMLINGHNIQFGSPLMDKLAIKYLLINKGVLETKRLFALPELSHAQAPPLPQNSLKQHLSLPKDFSIEAIGFMFGTYGKEHSPANVRLSIYNDRGLKFSLEPEIDKNKIFDNQWSFFKFPGKVYFPKGNYILVLSIAEITGADKLTVWATKINQEYKDSFLEVNGAPTDFSLKFQIAFYDKIDLTSFSRKWNIIDVEKDIVVFDNKQVTNSAYFVKNLDASNEQLDFSGLDVKQASVDRIDIYNSQTEAGWIVLPMRLHQDWNAFVDERRVKYDTYLDMMPAIPVQGASHVTFEYEPRTFQKGLKVTLAGVLIFLAFAGFCLRKTKKIK